MPGDGAEKGRRRGAVDDAMVKGGFPIVLAKFQLLRNYTFFHNEF
jgi:hypothetical protein